MLEGESPFRQWVTEIMENKTTDGGALLYSKLHKLWKNEGTRITEEITGFIKECLFLYFKKIFQLFPKTQAPAFYNTL